MSVVHTSKSNFSTRKPLSAIIPSLGWSSCKMINDFIIHDDNNKKTKAKISEFAAH